MLCFNKERRYHLIIVVLLHLLLVCPDLHDSQVDFLVVHLFSPLELGISKGLVLA